MRVLVLEPYLYDTAPGQRFRIEQWARLLEKQGVSFTFVPFESGELHRIMYRRGFVVRKAAEVLRGGVQRLRLLGGLRGFDVVFLFREAAPVGPAVLERLIARRGVPIVYDFDDAIYLPNASGANRIFSVFKCVGKTRTICRLSTHVTVGNEHLRRFASRHASRTWLVPTTIDVERYLPRPTRYREAPVVIGWMGSETTLPHLRMLVEPLRELASRRRFVLHVVSPAKVSLPGVTLRWTPWTAESEVRDLQGFDVGIMPLPDDRWARGKCGAKLLQYMGVGVPGVASPVGVNTEIVDDGVNGFLAGTPAEWVDRLTALIDSAPLREEMGAEGRRTVQERYSAQVHAPRLLDIFRQCPSR